MGESLRPGAIATIVKKLVRKAANTRKDISMAISAGRGFLAPVTSSSCSGCNEVCLSDSDSSIDYSANYDRYLRVVDFRNWAS